MFAKFCLRPQLRIHTLKQTATCFLLLLSWLLHGQDYYGSISAIALSEARESMVSDYTIVSPGVTDLSPGGSLTNSYVPAGSPWYVFFPGNSNLSSITSITMTTPTGSATITAYVTASPFTDIEFTLPFPVLRAQGYTLTLSGVTNPAFDPGCGATNTYYGSNPCNQGVFVGALNANGSYNIYEHTGASRFTITPANYFVSEITLEKTYSGLSAMAGTLQNELLLIRVQVKGSMGVLPSVQEISCQLVGNSFMSRLEYWYTGSKKTFHATGEVLLDAQNYPPASDVSGALNQPLRVGENYIWVVADLLCGSVPPGSAIAADLISIRISGTSFSATNPPGVRIIGNIPIASSNLVSNPGFEIYSSCPTTYTGQFIPVNNEIAKASGWNYLNLGTHIGTADYFHTCAVATQVHVPSNTFTGHQLPHGGDAYAGVANHGYFEYVTTQLQSPLIKDSIYIVSFYAVSAEGNFYKSNGIGAYLSAAVPAQSSANSPIGGSPQLKMQSILYDENDWVFLCDTVTAAGGEQWLTIGGFETIASAQTFRTNSAVSAYTLIDDVTVSKKSQTTATCTSIALFMPSVPSSETTQIAIQKSIVKIGDNEFQLQHLSDIRQVELYSSIGNLLQMPEYTGTIRLQTFPAGIYFLKVATDREFLVFPISLY